MTNQGKEERRAVLGKTVGISLLGSALFAFLCSLFIGGVGLLTAALIFSFFPTATVHIGTVGCVIGAITVFLGGVLAGKRQKHTGMLSGLLFGLLFLVLLLVIGRFYGSEALLIKRVIGYAILLSLSALGGALGTVRTGKRHRSKKRR